MLSPTVYAVDGKKKDDIIDIVSVLIFLVWVHFELTVVLVGDSLLACLLRTAASEGGIISPKALNSRHNGEHQSRMRRWPHAGDEVITQAKK